VLASLLVIYRYRIIPYRIGVSSTKIILEKRTSSESILWDEIISIMPNYKPWRILLKDGTLIKTKLIHPQITTEIYRNHVNWRTSHHESI